MTAGTTGDDQLTNDPNVRNETVSADAGNDVITIQRPVNKDAPFPSFSSVTVDGGSGYDILILSDSLIRPASGSSDIFIRVSSNFNYDVAYSNIEEIRLTGSLFADQNYTFGDTKDILHLSSNFTVNYVISTGGGDDQVYFGSSASGGGNTITINGGSGDDLLDASGGNFGGSSFVLNGGDGNDTLISSPRADTMAGGIGNDIYYVNDSGDVVTENAGEGYDEVRTTASSYALPANVEKLTYVGSGTATLDGGASGDTIQDGAGDQTLNGNGGDDTLIVSGGGTDTVNGGAGNDRLVIDARGFAGGVNLTVSGSSPYSGSATYGGGTVNYTGIENFTVYSNAGSSSDSVTTGDGDDVFYHYGINDAFYLMDTVNLGGGSNDLIVANFSAVTSYSVTSTIGGGGEYVLMVGGNGKVVATNAEQLSFIGGSQGDNVTGLSGNDEMHGGAGDDTLSGGDGNDALFGDEGNDSLNGGAGDDVVTVAIGTDSVDGGTGTDTLIIDYAAAQTNVSQGYSGFGGSLATGYGGSLTDFGAHYVTFSGIEKFNITTGIGNDDVRSGDGDDIVNLGAGDDFANVGAGLITADGGAGVDGITADFGALATSVSIDLNKASNAGAFGSISNFEYFGTLWTGSGDDVIVTTALARSETINLGAGNDTVTVVNGTDNVDGGTGTDTLIVDWHAATNGVLQYSQGFGGSLATGYGGSLYDTDAGRYLFFSGFEKFNITTGSGNDNIKTGDGDDVVSLGAGDDVVNVGAGLVTADGGAGTDVITADFGALTSSVSINLNNAVNAGAFGSISNFEAFGTLWTGSGDDAIVTTSAVKDETINLGGGNDIATVYAGTDNVDGGAGTDTLVIDYHTATGNISQGYTGFSGSVATGYSGSLSDFGTRYVAYSGIEKFDITTGSGNDTIATGDGDDVIAAGTGANTINAAGGNDIIRSVSGGIDTVDGGAGLDTGVVDYSNQTASIQNHPNPGAGHIAFTNGIDTSVNYVNVERFEITTGSGADNITTGSGNDIVKTGLGDDIVNVGSGDDEADGGGGTDTISADLSSATGAIEWDLVANTYSGQIGLFSNFERFGTVTTGSGDDVIVTGTGADNETINTGGGSDSITVQGGDDTVNAGTGVDTLIINYVNSTAAVALDDGLAGNVGGGYDGRYFDGQFAVTFTSVERFEITTGSGNDVISTGTGNDIVHSGGGDDVVNVGSGDDEADGGAGIDTISADLSSATGAIVWNLAANTYSGQIGLFSNFERFGVVTTGSGDDVITSGAGAYAETINTGAGNDSITVKGGDDTVNAGSGVDMLVIDYSQSTAALITTSAPAANNIGGYDGRYSDGQNAVSYSSVEKFDITSGSGDDVITTGDGDDVIHTNGGNDSIVAGAGNDYLDGGAGTDSMIGGLGNDVYVVDNAGDQVIENAGEGIDEVRTSLSTYTLAANIEKLTYTGTGNTTFHGNALDNVITGGSGNDFIYLNDGGNDQAIGGAGNDVFLFGATFTSGDKVNGGDGTDQLALQGDYWTQPLTFTADVLSIESLSILPGSDTRFGDPGTNYYDYNITTVDANVAAGDQMTVDANRLRVGEDFTFNGSAETDGSFWIFGGMGVDTLIGGAKNDVFLFGIDGRWGASDSVDGGGGINQLALRGNYTVTFGADQIHNILSLSLMSALDTRFGALGDRYNYNITMNDGNLAAGRQMTVDAGNLRGGEAVTFDGSAELDGSFRVFGGQSADHLTGSQGNDILVGSLGGDWLDGQGGNDIFRYRSAADSSSTHFDTISGFDGAHDVIDLPGTVSGWGSAAQGTLSDGTFDSDLAAALQGHMGANQAVLFTADAGQYAGQTFLVVDGDGDGAYTADHDYVIHLVSTVDPIPTSDTHIFV